MVKIANATTLEGQGDYTAWFFYGAFGSGKTTAAATFPRPLFIVPSQERSVTTLRGRDIDYALIESPREMETILCDLENKFREASRLWKIGTEEADDAADLVFPWQTIVVDALTHYADSLQESYGGENMDFKAWGQLGNHMRNLLMRLRRLPVHVVFGALARESRDTKGTLVKGEPAFPGASSYKLPAACDVVAYCEETGERFRVHFRSKGPYIARSRYRGLTELRVVEDFSWDAIRHHCGW